MNKENAEFPMPIGKFSKGFGEITYAGMNDVIKLLNTHVPFTKDSLFLDIGCGLGQPVYHAAIELGINATGVEILPLHVENA
jgi:cyclopropane fatty-acyl-phospholipid synthase-like methyltransferase